MQDYSKLIQALRCSDEWNCKKGCYYRGEEMAMHWCESRKMRADAAAAIEELLSFAHYVADKVTMSDEDWEDYHEAFTEVACRKLAKLGVISVEDDMYVYRQDEPKEVQE